MASAKKKEKNSSDPVIARNRKAFHDFEILETCEAGIVLVGTEVKSCRDHSVQLQDCFARIENGEILAYGIHIALYAFGNRFNHEAKRPRHVPGERSCSPSCGADCAVSTSRREQTHG